MYAETYVRMFYQNISRAIEKSDIETVEMVLKSFEYSNKRENRFDIVNCFETALVIYFLDPEIIKTIWRHESDKQVYLSI